MFAFNGPSGEIYKEASQYAKNNGDDNDKDDDYDNKDHILNIFFMAEIRVSHIDYFEALDQC